MIARPRGRLAVVLAAALLGALAVRADWLTPDPSYRDAQLLLRSALRDTAGQADNPARLDTLAVALLRLGRQGEARALFERVLALAPADPEARAGLGKLALFEDRLAAAESLLAGLPESDLGAARDRFAAAIRRGDWVLAARLAEPAGEAGRVALLEEIAREGAWVMAPPGRVVLPWTRAHPVPLVKVRLNGQQVLMAVSTATGDLLIDESAAKRTGVRRLASDAAAYWSGTRVAARQALVQRLEIGGLRIERVPAGLLKLGRYSLEVNPQGETIGGVIGFALLRRFTPTLDWKRQTLELLAPGAPLAIANARRIPFQMWGESGVTVEGTIAGGRKMAMLVDTAIPAAGVGAPPEVFEELGVRPGVMSRMVRNAGVWLQGGRWTAVRVPSVSVGTLARGELGGWSGALDAAELWRHGVRRDAILAGEFFRGLRVTFDWEGRALIVEE